MVCIHVLLQRRGVVPCAVETLQQGTAHHHLDLTNDVASVSFSRVAAETRFERSLFERTSEGLVSVSRCVPTLRAFSWLFLLCLCSTRNVRKDSALRVSWSLRRLCSKRRVSRSNVVGECGRYNMCMSQRASTTTRV